MAISMTGFGREKCENKGYEILIEMRSVNNRYFDAGIRLPRNMGFLEEKIRTYLKTRINRGKIDFYTHIKATNESEIDIKLDKNAAKKYYDAYKELSEFLNIPFDLTATTLGGFPDILTATDGEADEEKICEAFFPVLEKATDDIIEMRKKEGKRLAEDVLKIIGELRIITDEIEKRLPQSVLDYEKRLREKMEENLQGVPYDEARLITEVAIFSDKVATFEETTRLKSHFDSFSELAVKEAPVGKKLDFLVQEMNREINTVCSKCQDLEISRLGIDAKSKIEAIREQIQNIE